jgi:hypothetical protein
LSTMPGMSEEELAALERKCDVVKASRLSLEEKNEKILVELNDAQEKLRKITEGKGGFQNQADEYEPVS